MESTRCNEWYLVVICDWESKKRCSGRMSFIPSGKSEWNRWIQIADMQDEAMSIIESGKVCKRVKDR